MAQVERGQTSTEGALLELIARGEKDKYFQKDAVDAEHPFDWRYKKFPATIPEIRRTVPITEPVFGGRVDWDMDLPGDILTEASITIQLPSWIPDRFQAFNKTGLIQDLSGNSYGYVRGIAYFLFKKIQFLQDNILISEFSGDDLYLMDRSVGSWNSGFLSDKLHGIHNGSSIAIQRNAIPERLVLSLPLPGCQHKSENGFPICAVRGQTFRIRVWLRNLGELIESTDQTQISPAPWTKELRCTKDGSTWTQFEPIPKDLIKRPLLFLETKQIYLSNDDRKEYATREYKIPFVRPFSNNFVLNESDYKSLRNIQVLTQPFITRILDANYTVEKLVIAFRSMSKVRMNQLYSFVNPGGSSPTFFSNLQMTIAGQVREGPWDAFVWNRLVPYVSSERSTEIFYNYLNWSKGIECNVQSPAKAMPTGGINFTTADRPTLYLVPNDTVVDPVIGERQTEFFVIAESWALYHISNGRGSLAFAN